MRRPITTEYEGQPGVRARDRRPLVTPWVCNSNEKRSVKEPENID
jgi:hypothetical protein